MLNIRTLKPSPQNIALARFLIDRASHDQKVAAGVHTMDASDLTGLFARELEYIDAKIRETQYAPLQSERWITYDPCGGQGVESVTFRQVTELGQAEWIGNIGGSLPRVDVVGDEITRGVENMGVAWGFTIFNMLNNQSRPSIKMDVWRKSAAHMAIRRKHDTAAMIGDAGFGWTGLVNDTNIPLVTAAGSGTAWLTASALEMVADVNKLTWTIYNNTYGQKTPTLLLVPDVLGMRLDQPMGDNADKTVRSFILANSAHIKKIETTHWLDNADAGGNGPRIMAFPPNDDEVMKYGANAMFGEEAPQQKDLEIVVPCWGRSSGLHVLEPLACGYMDVD